MPLRDTPRLKEHHTAQQTPSSSTAGGRRGGEDRSSLVWLVASSVGEVGLRANFKLTDIPKDVPEARLQGAPHRRCSLERRWRQEQRYSRRGRVQEVFVRQYLHLQTGDDSWSLVAGKSNPETLGATGSRWWPVAGLVKRCVSPGLEWCKLLPQDTSAAAPQNRTQVSLIFCF